LSYTEVVILAALNCDRGLILPSEKAKHGWIAIYVIMCSEA